MKKTAQRIAAAALAATAGWAAPGGHAVPAEGVDAPITTIEAIQPNRKSGKMRAPLEMTYNFRAEPRIGEGVYIDLEFRAERRMQSLDVQVNVPEGLSLIDGDAAMSFGLVEPSRPNEYPIQIVPQADGLRYVNVIASAVVDGERLVRTFAVPVQVGAVRGPAPASKVTVTPDGDAVVSLPAWEDGNARD